jgi:membrane fusion protein (multidrug efflux system)
MIKKIILAIVAIVLVFAALAGIKAMQIGTLIAFGKSFVPPPETVSSAVAQEEKWQDFLPAVGSVTAVQGVMITVEIPGTVQEIKFESGAIVAKGDLLLSLDTSSEEAQLRAAEAQAELAATTLARTKSLRAENTVSQAELDTAEMTLKQSQANADTIRTTIAKKIIRAPFAGRLGIRQVNVGEYLDKGKAIVSLQSLAPVYGDFSLPQQDLARVTTGMKVRAITDTYPDKQFDGVLTAINPDLDVVTRSVRVQATFENAEQLLRSGMFARFEVLLPQEQKVLAVPNTAILSAPYGDSVYLIEATPATNGAPAGLVVRQKFVRIGRARGDYVNVETGLKAGDRVVRAGIFKLRNGMQVVENNDLNPASEKKPNPSDS